MKQGYLGIFRKFFDEHEFWKEKRKYSRAEAWIDLMQCARYGEEPETLFDKRGSYTLEYGDVYISLRYLGERWQWSKNKVKGFLDYLEKRESIMVKKRDSHRTIINIVNLGSYVKWIQGERDSEGTVKGQSRDSEGTKKKKVNKEKNENNKNIYENFPSLNIPKWEEWLKYKALIKAKYKTERGEKSKISELINMSNGDSDLQGKIIDQAIDCEWQGLHPLKDGGNNGKDRQARPNKQTGTDKAHDILQNLYESQGDEGGTN